nr:GTPase Era [Cupriavidus sp.]
MVHRVGFVALVGRPNVGKSSLLNALVGMQLAITSRKAQTTRHRILGVRTTDSHQIFFVDTPGIQHTHTAALNRQLNRTALSALQEVSAVAWVIEAHKLRPEDEEVLARIPPAMPVVVAMNKADRLTTESDKAKAFALVAQLQSLRPSQPHSVGQTNQSNPLGFKAIVPVSAVKGFQVDVLAQALAECLPEGPPQVDADTVTDRSTRFFVAEIIREKLFRFLGDELPYEATVVIDQFSEEPSQAGRPAKLVVAATIIVGRDSHKPMVLGEGGARLRQIGSQARQDIAAFCDAQVRLDLWVKVKENWADTDSLVRSFGYE